MLVPRVGAVWWWSYRSWVFNYLCSQCLSPLVVSSWCSVLDTTLCDKVCQWLVTGWWFSPGTPVSSTNKTDRHDITEIFMSFSNSLYSYQKCDLVQSTGLSLSNSLYSYQKCDLVQSTGLSLSISLYSYQKCDLVQSTGLSLSISLYSYQKCDLVQSTGLSLSISLYSYQKCDLVQSTGLSLFSRLSAQ
jgi:hypothetical protein